MKNGAFQSWLVYSARTVPMIFLIVWGMMIAGCGPQPQVGDSPEVNALIAAAEEARDQGMIPDALILLRQAGHTPGCSQAQQARISQMLDEAVRLSLTNLEGSVLSDEQPPPIPE